MFVSAIDPAENHRLLRRSLPDQVQGNDRVELSRVDIQGRKLNDFTHAQYGPPGNFHNLICEFTPEQFHVKVLFPFDSAGGASNGGDFNIDPNDVRIHPRNSQPFSAIMHIAWRLMRGVSSRRYGRVVIHVTWLSSVVIYLGYARLDFCASCSLPGIRHDGHRDLYSSIIFDFFAQFLDHLAQPYEDPCPPIFVFDDTSKGGSVPSIASTVGEMGVGPSIAVRRHGDGKWGSPST